MEGTRIQALMSIFPILRTMDGAARTIQLDLIDKNFNIVYEQIEGQAGNFKRLSDGSPNPYYFGRATEGIANITLIIVKYDNVTLRGRRKVNLRSQYVKIIKSSDAGNMPSITMYENSFESSGQVVGKNWQGRDDDCWDTPLHPHISRNTPCLGSFENMLYKESKTNPLAYFTIIGKFYRTWNIDSCYWNINTMEPLLADSNEENSKVLLSPLEFMRIRNLLGTRVSQLRAIIPYFIENDILLVDSVRPLSVLSYLRDEWNDMFRYRAKDELRRILPDWNDSFANVYSELEKLDNCNYKMYKQDIFGADNRAQLSHQLHSLRLRYEEKFSMKLLAKFEETLSNNLGAVLDAMQIPNYDSTDLIFNKDLLESSNSRFRFLQENNIFYSLSSKEMMAYFDRPLDYPNRKRYEILGTDSLGNRTSTLRQFTPEDISSKLDTHRLKCGQIAINELNKQKDVIINEIKSIKDNTIKNLVVQQQISF